MKIVYTVLFALLTACILTHSQLSLAYALMGLQLWFEKMIPALLPFMILSGIMIRMRVTEQFSRLIYPVIRPVFRVSPNACYAMFMGFLCGFPMGSKTIADLLSRKMLSKREAEYLLAFCNNIGPVYFCSFVLPLLGRKLVLPYLFGMYGLPLLYGLILRYTRFRDLSPAPGAAGPAPAQENTPAGKENLLYAVDDAVTSSVQSILSLGGYMILFNLMNLPFHILLNRPPVRLAPLFEITGGLKLTGGRFPLLALLLLPFGGFSCIAQTYSCIKGTSLSLSQYVAHKLLLTAMTGVYYLGWFLLFPSSFLR